VVRYEYELGKAAGVLTRELFKLKPGETFVITADTESNPHVVNATARAAFSIGCRRVGGVQQSVVTLFDRAYRGDGEER